MSIQDFSDEQMSELFALCYFSGLAMQAQLVNDQLEDDEIVERSVNIASSLIQAIREKKGI